MADDTVGIVHYVDAALGRCVFKFIIGFFITEDGKIIDNGGSATEESCLLAITCLCCSDDISEFFRCLCESRVTFFCHCAGIHGIDGDRGGTVIRI